MELHVQHQEVILVTEKLSIWLFFWPFITLYIAKTMYGVELHQPVWFNRINRGVDNSISFDARNYIHCCLSFVFSNDFNVSQCETRDST
jgi:hypothetical protein